jgi:hypothetical protein
MRHTEVSCVTMMPPSARTVCPTIIRDASEARRRATPAESSRSEESKSRFFQLEWRAAIGRLPTAPAAPLGQPVSFVGLFSPTAESTTTHFHYEAMVES